MVKASSSTLYHLPPSALSVRYLMPTYVGAFAKMSRPRNVSSLVPFLAADTLASNAPAR
jgi:hypothetical protein